MDEFVNQMFTLDRWPFWAAVLVFTIMGQFTSKHLFTRERAYVDWGMPAKGVRPFWYWGRETLTIHPLIAGFLLGFFWRDPENKHWPVVASEMYFAAAGAISLFGWVFVKALAKKRGFNLSLPGNSSNPPPFNDERPTSPGR